MLDYETDVLESKIEFYKKDIDDRFKVNGFRGTWAFSDHNLIPQIFNGFLQRHFGVMRIKRIKLEDINNLLNELWEGPGSLEKILRLEYEMKLAGKDIKMTASDLAKIKKEDIEDDPLPIAVFGETSDEDWDGEQFTKIG